MITSYLAFRVLCRLLPALVCLACAVELTAQTKVIRLRNGALTNEPPVVQPRTQATIPSPVSGLYLVQFTGPVRPEWRTELATLGAQLVRYLPDDAFITRFNNTPLDLVRAKSYVFFVGEYAATHKVHTSVGDQLRAGPAVQMLNVRIVLSPVATLTERAEVHRRMGAFRGLSRNRFGDILQGELPVGQLAAVLNSPAVLWMEGPANMRLSDEIASKIVGGGIYGTPGAPHFTDVQQLGYTGAGVTVAVADSGLHNGDAGSMHPDLAGRVTAFFHYGDLFDAADEHAHGTHVTGIIAGNAATGEADENGAWYGLGVAPEARIVAQRMFDGIGLYNPPDSMEQLTRDAVRAGAEIGSNSWGDDARGRYDTFAAEFDALTRDADFETPGDQPYILEFSSGNSGPVSSSINTPAVAKNVIATGASQNERFDFFIYAEGSEAMADFSSRGPAEDGRIKPDLVAPGTWIASLQSASASDENAWLGISEYYQYQGGTSQAGPHVSGAAAAFVQYYREMNGGLTPSPAMVKAALINSAWDMDDSSGTIATPNMDEGWGRVDLVNLIGGFGRRDFIDQTELLTTGQVYERRALVVDSFEPLIITLTYTDVPGLPASIPALVNNLDLVVTGPDGQMYHGNRFDSFGVSVPGTTTGDRINNVEGIYIDSPTPGEWVVRVVAQGVFEDARIDTVEIDQDFALVVSAFLPPPNAAVLLMDRSAYRAPSEIKLKVFDFDLLNAGSVTVNLTSSTEPAGFPVTLNNAGTIGIFTGTVATATAPAVSGDSLLQISDGDLIRATYFDESRGVTESAQAVGDFQPPQVFVTGVEHEFGRTFVSIASNESTQARVLYGTNAPPKQVAFGNGAAELHQVELKNLVPFELYYVAVELTDIAGNVAYYDVGGTYVQFVAQPPSTVLLVNAYTDDPPDSDTPPIPLSAYTQSLMETGVTFEVWDKATMGSPTLDALSPFRVVIWRINDSIWTPGDSLNANEQTAITSYLNNGGGFFISSMELLSRMGPTAFRTNVLQVQEFLPNTDPFGEPCADCDEDFQVPFIVGEDYDMISDGVVADLDYSAYPFIDLSEIGIILGPDFSDTFTPTTNGVSIFYEPNDKTCGIRFPRVGTDSPGRVVFLSFPLDTIPRDNTTSGRTAVLGNALRFLAPGLNGLGSIALDNFEYTIPDQITVEVADSDLEGLPSAEVTFFSSVAPAGVTVTLTETITPGLFRGILTLVNEGEPAAPARLPVTSEDLISARYFDESQGTYRTTFAVIDVVPPEIYNVVVDPQYTEAVIDWEVSEYTDGVVEFSESPFFQGQTYRTAANPRFLVAHSLLLTGLKPDQLYHYRIVSRDVAGNTTVLTTGLDGQPLTFTTLRPETAPWSDDLEFTGQYDWDVLVSEGSDGQWELGIIPPADGGAHSGSVVWATNLRGLAQGAVESFLISPPIAVTGGNRATLRFWQDYDFFDFTDKTIFEFGQLLLLTNTVSQPLVLAQYEGETSSFGWEEQEFDLTPHLNKVVYVVWHYFFLDAENERKRGWRIDDVSVTVEQITPGELTVASSLAQGMFNISGPINRTRHPWYFHDGNAPPGEYEVTFVGVPYYQTPPAQYETLEPGGMLSITGNYTIVDTNNNGIADNWEQQFFGTVSPAHPADHDSDGDGLSDLHEFLLGTIPTNAASALKLSTPLLSDDNVVQVNWPATLGRAYRLESSDATLNWSPVVDWYRSLSNSGTFKQVAPSNGALLFRLRAQP